MSASLIGFESMIDGLSDDHPNFVGTTRTKYARAILSLTSSFRRKPNPRIEQAERFRSEEAVVSSESMAELVKYLPSLPVSFPEFSARDLTELKALIERMAESHDDFVLR